MGGEIRVPLTITVDGQILDTEEAYINDRGVTMIPLRAAAEALGYTVNWDPRTRTAAITSAPAEEGPAVVGPGEDDLQSRLLQQSASLEGDGEVWPSSCARP